MSSFDRANPSRAAQRGSVAVEMALVMLIFVSLVLGTIDLGRWLYAITATQEAAREGARVAAVCNLNASAINTHMHLSLVTVTTGTPTVTYQPGGCCAREATCLPVCSGVTVTLTGYQVPRVAWFMPTMTIPTVTTYLPRESLDSTSNARCS
jgi:Flp pilus assembly protein TadG